MRRSSQPRSWRPTSPRSATTSRRSSAAAPSCCTWTSWTATSCPICRWGRRSSRAIRRVADVPLDVHLMIDNPDALYPGVRRRRRVADHGPRRGAAAPASDAAGHPLVRRQGRRGDQSRRRRSARSKKSRPTSIRCWSCRSIRALAARLSSRAASLRSARSALCSTRPAIRRAGHGRRRRGSLECPPHRGGRRRHSGRRAAPFSGRRRRAGHPRVCELAPGSTHDAPPPSP